MKYTVNFLRQNRLLVDPAANRLVDTLSFESFPTVTVFHDLTEWTSVLRFTEDIHFL